MVAKEMPIGGCIPCSYVVRIFEQAGMVFMWDDDQAMDSAMATYDTNTINLRAATEYIAMVARSHAVDPEDVHFRDGCYDLELSWRSYAELR